MNRVRALKGGEEIRLFEARAEGVQRKYGILVAVGIETGLRISDILNLRVKDILKGRVCIREQKTKKAREIEISEELIQKIKKYQKAEGLPKSAYLVPTSARNPNRHLSRVQAYRVLKRVSEGLNIQGIGTHSMRKTYALNLFLETRDIEQVRKELNHEYISTTMLYLFDDETLRILEFKER